ncbi:MAG: class I SAM-dependent methyltransferase [Clostridia bacterium]|nr:class I SAM-dependent methyltransferase [Clostridia bacterium]
MVDLLALQKKFILAHLKEGDTAVDFTMGNGYDTVFLSQTVGETGRVIAFDIQEKALTSTEHNLRSNGCPDNWRLICASHDRANEFITGPIKAGMFNLGYLPGAGKKQLTTKRTTTLPAVERAMNMLGEDSVLLVAVYPGHPEGEAEGRELCEYFAGISRFKYSIAQFRMLNSPESPFFIVIETK